VSQTESSKHGFSNPTFRIARSASWPLNYC
jgi:hypothetical protein